MLDFCKTPKCELCMCVATSRGHRVSSLWLDNLPGLLIHMISQAVNCGIETDSDVNTPLRRGELWHFLLI